MHLKRKIPCKKDINNHYSDVEIDILNKNQFEKNNITKNIECDTFIKKQNIISSLKQLLLFHFFSIFQEQC